MIKRRTATVLAALGLALGSIGIAAGPAHADDGPCADIPAGLPVIAGNNLNNVLVGGAGPEIFLAFDGNDTVFGGGGNDYIFGGAGDDELYGMGGNDCIDGGVGWDQGFGGAGANLCSTPATEVQVNC